MVDPREVQKLWKQFMQIIDGVIGGSFTVEEVKAWLQYIIEKVYPVGGCPPMSLERVLQDFPEMQPDLAKFTTANFSDEQPCSSRNLRLIEVGEDCLTQEQAEQNLRARGYTPVTNIWDLVAFIALYQHRGVLRGPTGTGIHCPNPDGGEDWSVWISGGMGDFKLQCGSRAGVMPWNEEHHFLCRVSA